MNSTRQIGRWEHYFWPLFAVAIAVLIWQFSVRLTGSKIFPSPLDVERGIAELIRKGLLWRYIGDSLRRVGIGYCAAALLGIPVGLALGLLPAAAQVVNPVIQMLRPISPIAWIPLAILWFGVNDFAAVYLIFLAAFFPIVVSSMGGVRDVPARYRQSGRNFGLSPLQLVAKIVFPASIPQIIIGLRIALGISWLVVVAAEMIAVDSGLGYLVIDARNSGKRYDLVVAAMLMIGVIGLGLDLAIRRLEKLQSVRWGFGG